MTLFDPLENEPRISRKLSDAARRILAESRWSAAAAHTPEEQRRHLDKRLGVAGDRYR
ncbi:MAG TPA: hypothetical protein VES88_14265 [Gemmatimonadaceae bacterium]|nr:hypothetical protein [Gemmatimonadaceae bacterium]